MILMKLRKLAFLNPNLDISRQGFVEFGYFYLKHLTWADNIILIKYIYCFEIRVSCLYQCQIPLSFEVQCLKDIERKRM